MAQTDGLLGWLAGLDQRQLAKVLANRPDVLTEPWPRRLDRVAARLDSPPSLDQATLALATPQVQVMRAIQLCFALGTNPVPVADVARWLDTGTDVVESFVDDFADRALAWRSGGGIMLAESLQSDSYSIYGLGKSVRDLLGDLTAAQLAQLSSRLGLPSKARRKDLYDRLVAFFQDREGLRELVATAPEPTRNLLADMAGGIPEIEGLVPFHPRQGTPGAWAFERGILFGTYYGSAYMSLEVSLALRGPDYRLPFTPDEPEYPTSQIGTEAVEAASASAALRLLDRVSTILDLAAEPLPLLKNGTIGARLVKKIAKDIGGTPAEIELALDLATRASLLVVNEPEPAPRPRRGKAPTPPPPALVVNDQLVRPSPAVLYRHLLSCWWEVPAGDFVDDIGQAGEDIQRLMLRLLARLDPGTGVLDIDALTRLTQWHAPMYQPDDVVTHVQLALDECELLGLIASGAVTGLGRAMLDANTSALVKATDELVAHARTTALFGTDLTAIVPGSPDAGLAALLDRAADRENQGTATSWRFSPATVRRAFDQGATAATLLDELGSIAAGELPQPLVYLVNDVARRHGEAQVIDVASVVIGEDPALLAEIAAHRKLAKLGLHAVAPTVLTSIVDAAGTIDALRDAGYAPTRHAADGSIIIPARDQIAPTAVVIRDDAGPDDESAPPPDPLEHAARLLATPATGPILIRGQLAKVMSDRYRGRLTPKQQQLCWQLEAGLPVPVSYRTDGEEPAELLIGFPELQGGVLDVWSIHEREYRRLELDRIDLAENFA